MRLIDKISDKMFSMFNLQPATRLAQAGECKGHTNSNSNSNKISKINKKEDQPLSNSVSKTTSFPVIEPVKANFDNKPSVTAPIVKPVASETKQSEVKPIKANTSSKSNQSNSFTSESNDLAFSNTLVSEQKNPFSTLDITADIPTDTLNFIRPELAKKFGILPFDFNIATNTLQLYFTNSIKRDEALRQLKTNHPQIDFKFVHLDESLLTIYIDEQYCGIGSEILQKQKEAHREHHFSQVDTSQGETKAQINFEIGRLSDEDNRIFAILKGFVCDAHHLRATDVDMFFNRTPFANGVWKTEMLVLVRIDGMMRDLYRKDMGLDVYRSFIRVLRTVSNLDSAREREDGTGLIKGRIKYGTKESQIELRVNFIHAGNEQSSSISIRIQDKFGFKFNLKNLGFFPSQQAILDREVLNASDGLVLFAGRINTGKNGSLISTLLELQQRHPEYKIVTIEHPTEVVLPGINQIEVTEGRGYADYMPQVLRHNPDIIVLSEVRTSADATACVEASILGHLTLTTIHANTSTEVIRRLNNLSIDYANLADCLRAVVSQRLVQKNCDKCVMVEDKELPEVEYLSEYIKNLKWEQEIRFIRASGHLADGRKCPNCLGSGVKGRFGIFEIFKISASLRELIANKASNWQLRKQAISEGMHTMWMNGLTRALMGETRLSEVISRLSHPDPEMEGLDIAVNNTFDEANEVYM